MTRPPRTDRYRCPIGSKPRVKRPESELDPIAGRGSKTDGPGGNGPIPTIQADGSNDPPAVQADPAPDPVTPISAHGRVKRPADGQGQKEPDQNRPDSRARVKTSPHATQRITASSRGNDVLVLLVCRIRNGRKTGRARSVHGPSGPVRATRVTRYRPLTRYRRNDDPSHGSKPADRDRI